MNESNQVHQDHSCSICLTAFYLPVQITKCKHQFCKPCLQDNAFLSGHRKCPLCRVAYTPQHLVNADKLRQQTQKLYPEIIEEKKKSIKARRLVNLRIGNTTREIHTQENNKYEWTIFVKSAQGQKPLKQFAKKIEIKLHPTFSPNKIIYDMSNLNEVELKRIGWGTFRIYITVIWKDIFEQRQTEFFHDLQFDPLVEKQIGCYLNEKKQEAN